MKLLKKIGCFVLAAMMSLGVAVVQASAYEFEENAVEVFSGEQVDFQIGKGETKNFMIDLDEKTDLNIHWSMESSSTNIYVYDSFGTEVAGPYYFRGSSDKSYLSSYEQNFPLEKGKYYFSFKASMYQYGSGKGKMIINFGETETEPEVKISYLGLSMKKGTSIQLSAVLEGGSDTVSWFSSKKTVATVSKTGKVTAKKKGTAVISAKCGESVVKIKITVK